jgi:AraC-like DNA-binding protein
MEGRLSPPLKHIASKSAGEVQMPSSAVRTFSDPDEYAAAIRNSKAEMTVTGRGQFSAELIQVDFHRLWIQRFSESLPRIAHSAHMGRAVVTFRTRPGPRLLWNGAEMQPTNIVWHSERESAFQRSSGPTSFAAMSLPVEDMAAIGSAMVGFNLVPPKDMLINTPAPRAMARLQRLHAAAGQLAEDAPEIIDHPETARGLEQALIEAMVDCLSKGEVREDRSAQRRHSAIMRRFRTAVEENPDQPLYIPELCAVIGVADRTLRVCCQEQLGMSPKRYLLVRRMNLARQALRAGSSGATTVTEIAAQFGFWQFGRFAGEYKLLFGEAPSATLQHPRQ